MNYSRSFRHTERAIVILAVIALVLSTLHADAAYLIDRPVALDDEPINQGNLYGIGGHKGLDWSTVAFGDNVFAVASGRVADVASMKPDDCHPSYPPNDPRYCTAWGNYVLIQHNDRHYDRVSEQTAYVYSLYMHLRQNSIVVTEGANINQGTRIAQVDNTGNSTGNHLHLQVVLHPNENREIEPVNTLDSEARSRNPELWLDPYPGTGTVVGKVTNTNGEPVGGLYVYGLQKQAGWGYGSSLTYNNDVLKPDDILVENWGTTDVTPGTYTITLSNGYNFGRYTVQAGRITYVGLYPVWLPNIRGNYGGWNSTIAVRNNSNTFRAQVNTTFFNPDGTVYSQRQPDYINANATANLAAPDGFVGSAVVVSSEDVSVVVLNLGPAQSVSYNGPAASNGSDLGVGKTLYTPLSLARYGNWHTQIRVQNVSPAAATVSITYYDANGNGIGPFVKPALSPGAAATFDANADLLNLFTGSAIVTSNQDVAATVTETDGNMSGLYNGVSAGATTLRIPLVLRGWGGWETSIQLQNLEANPANASITYYNSNGAVAYSVTCPAIAGRGFCNVPLTIAPPWSGVAVVTSNRVLAAEVDEYNSGTGDLQSYNGLGWAAPSAVLPRVVGGGGWTTGLQIQNAGARSDVQVLAEGSTEIWRGWIEPNGWQNVPVNTTGSLVVQSRNGQNLVTEVDLYWPVAGDYLMSYTGVSR